MTKSDLIARMAARHPQLFMPDAELTVKSILNALTYSIAAGQRIEIRGFGSFYLHRRPARIGRNPKTGETVRVPEKSVPHFKAGKELRERVYSAGQPISSRGSRISSAAGGSMPDATASRRNRQQHPEQA